MTDAKSDSAAALVAKLGEICECGHERSIHRDGDVWACKGKLTGDYNQLACGCPGFRAASAYTALAVNSFGLVLEALEKDDKLAVHRRRCSKCTVLTRCERDVALYADAEATRAEALATVRDAAQKALT